MTPKESRHQITIGLSAFVLLGLLLFLIYSNAFHATWHLDDYNSIIGNKRIHADASRPFSLLKPFQSLYNSEPLNRPFAHFTLALNWYLGQDDPGGYILVNIFIHLLSAFFLFRTVLILFETPRLRNFQNRSHIHFVSLLAAVLWAVNPIQVQAITYIVQRMAALCGMFYLAGIYFYVSGRLSQVSRQRYLKFAACLVAFVFAFFSKENAATLPLALLLVEATFFQDLSERRVRRKLFLFSAALALMVIVAGLWLFFKSDLSGILTSYDKRYFTPIQRLLTQPRILIFYISLIFYPTPDRLSLVHDIQVSTSLWHPWTTSLSCLAILGLIGLSIKKLRDWPIISFAILFFFLTHLIESTIIPLELIFEHRNYLPSMFVFWPIALGIDRLIFYYRSKSRMIHAAVIAFVPLLIVGLGTGTYIRNTAWLTEKSLWEDALGKAPESARPYINLAWAHYERRGDPQTALVFYHEALRKKHNRNSQYAKIYNNIANIYYLSGDCERAVEYWRRSSEVSVNFHTPQYRLAMALVRCGRLDDALVHLDHILQQAPDFGKAIKLKGVILLLQHQPRKALAQFRKCVKMEPGAASHFINLGAGFVLLGDHNRAELFFNRALRETGRERLALLWSAVNYIGMEDSHRANLILDELAAKVPLQELTLWLQKGFEARVYKSDIIFPAVDEKLVSRLTARYKQALPELEKLSSQ